MKYAILDKNFGYVATAFIEAGFNDRTNSRPFRICRLYTSDAADDLRCVDLAGRRIIKKKKNKK